MLIVVSPAKSLDFETPVKTEKFSKPAFLSEATELVRDLKKLHPEELQELMGISETLAAENFSRYSNWHTPFNLDNARQAIFAFKGDVYLGLKAEHFGASDLNFAQRHLRILSGLYGVLRPLDLMQPYRLEMGTTFAARGKKNLYEFWGCKLTAALNQEFEQAGQKHNALINLASNEYFSSLDTKALKAKIVTPVFKDWAKGQYRVLSFYAKRARGEMAAYIIKNRINSPTKLKDFNVGGYKYSEEESSSDRIIFNRKQKS